VWTSEPVWTIWRRENSWPDRDSNSDPSVVQPVASRYTDYAIPAPDPRIKRTKIICAPEKYWQVQGNSAIIPNSAFSSIKSHIMELIKKKESV
jgi:hypothetical protein